MEEESKQSPVKTEQILTEVVANLRSNPKKYATLRKALKSATTDQEVAKELIHFATNEKELAALIPARAKNGSPGVASWTITVTVITVVSHD
jgi:hypothetical protein